MRCTRPQVPWVLPALQSRQSSAPVELTNLPARDAPVMPITTAHACFHEPGAQARQAICDSDDWKKPAAHATQAVCPSRPCALPLPHGRHVVDALADEKVPDGQATHCACPAELCERNEMGQLSKRMLPNALKAHLCKAGSTRRALRGRRRVLRCCLAEVPCSTRSMVRTGQRLRDSIRSEPGAQRLQAVAPVTLTNMPGRRVNSAETRCEGLLT